jgi:hypothetical protein
MFTRNAKLVAVGAFLSGGILVGGVTAATDFTHVGATTAPAPGKGQSSAEYTSVNAWVQEVTTAPSNTLVIPSGQRLTITNVTSTYNSQPCTVTGAVNGVAADYVLYATVDGLDASTFRPVSVDSGNITCGSVATQGTVELVGYLTPQSEK